MERACGWVGEEGEGEGEREGVGPGDGACIYPSCECTTYWMVDAPHGTIV